MAWIESHSNLARHPKTRRLMKLLGWSLPDTIGNLHLLWWWAQDFAPTGDLSHFSAEDLTADLDLCGATPEQFVEAMVAAGFLDRIEGTLCIHDWTDYNRPKFTRRTTRSVVGATSSSKTSAPHTLSRLGGMGVATPASSSRPAPATAESDDLQPVCRIAETDSAVPAGEVITSDSASTDSSPHDRVAVPAVPHALDEQPGFTDIWWPKFLDIHKANGTPLTLDARRELLARLARNPFSAVELLRALINETANAITPSAPEETLTRHASSRRDDVGVASPVPNTS